jgi:rod shape-determining protein MreD
MSLLRGAGIFLVAAFLQWWWPTHFSFWGLSPQILLVLTVVLAARQGPDPGMCYGFLWGLFLDTMSPHLFGANAFSLMLAGYVTGILRRQIDLMDVAPLFLVIFLATWGYFLTLGLLAVIFTKTFLWVGWGPFLVDPFYNCLLAPVAVSCWKWSRASR